MINRKFYSLNNWDLVEGRFFGTLIDAVKEAEKIDAKEIDIYELHLQDNGEFVPVSIFDADGVFSKKYE